MTVLEVLESALINIKAGSQFQRLIGISQLEKAISQLEKNPNTDDEYVEAEG